MPGLVMANEVAVQMQLAIVGMRAVHSRRKSLTLHSAVICANKFMVKPPGRPPTEEVKHNKPDFLPLLASRMSRPTNLIA